MTRDEALALKKLGELLGGDITGWKLMMCYFLRIKTSVRVLLPALVDDEINSLIVSDTNLLPQIHECMPSGSYTVGQSVLALVHLEAQRGFNLRNQMDLETPPFHLRTEAEIQELIRRKARFYWPEAPMG